MYNKNNNSPYPTTAPTSTRRRTHLKPSQVAVLQESFVVNALPDATIRAQLAQELGVTERTVQIWFQNRRAKARKSSTLEPNVRTGWIDVPVAAVKPKQKEPDHQPFQATFRTLVTPECYEESSHIKKRPRSNSKPEKFVTTQSTTPPPKRAMSEGVSRITCTQEEPFISIPVTMLRIGTWARFASLISENQYDLVCFGDSHQLNWQIQDGGHHFRIHVDYHQVKQIRLSHAQLDLGQLEIEVADSLFSMKRIGTDPDWIQCGDFTENRQASVDTVHVLQGDHNQLRHCLLELIAQAPHLASKLVLLPPTDYLCRDVSISPSATPEPIYFDQNQWLDPKEEQQPFSFLSQHQSPTFDQSNWILDPLLTSENNFLTFI
ncbi:hypothetical protein G6F46_006990 [Rhizopus delemar]|uniref:Homeobox domain-containing protein n=3 Tax=Rhizopus TaxID=4842 RepID=I1CH36_RHIO9|nr:hypothetical protein RO3G_12477 [Rhizopus delemar RA 99-880]KAG1457884.1 hypothetical protein G6F55_005661 [Rhizopus delemar]KAG1548004.1 hypothetical protein G6F51_003927 [Rhizopus arrhizus]KAG1501138.1 hypothetical protein G6F54_003237 [Rhizopus delemar]KAG1510218.1 hypothetical protein G6F53_006843 [Rhizopus delemar]|eukprot:EIE87766.1 hypothetical protein RO3G_12477 [Rhizopus delemar RA 99-880]